MEQDAWNSALARARGERILDDPKLLSRCAPHQPACPTGKACGAPYASSWISRGHCLGSGDALSTHAENQWPITQDHYQWLKQAFQKVRGQLTNVGQQGRLCWSLVCVAWAQVAEEGGEAAEQEDGCLEGAQGAAGQGSEDEAEKVSYPCVLSVHAPPCLQNTRMYSDDHPSLQEPESWVLAGCMQNASHPAHGILG